jgi:hypothetical protein
MSSASQAKYHAFDRELRVLCMVGYKVTVVDYFFNSYQLLLWDSSCRPSDKQENTNYSVDMDPVILFFICYCSIKRGSIIIWILFNVGRLAPFVLVEWRVDNS